METTSPRAVFLSYASQDAAAARRLAEALRASGVEVWFDQNELVGGEAWDAKIRGQIASCALFVPVISANTQARLEGYFRLEWKLAAQRTHTMADERVFLLPVVIDETKDAEAKVPAEFKVVQWTRLPGGDGAEKFCARVKRLLAAEGAVEAPEAAGGWPTAPAATAQGRRGLRELWWMVFPILGGVTGLVFTLRFAWPGESRRAGGGPVPAAAPAAESEAWKLAQRAISIATVPAGVTRERLEAADELCKRALALDPVDGRILGAAAQVDATWVYYQMDKSDSRRQQAQTRVARAAVLAPEEPRVRFAQALVYHAVVGTPAMLAEAERVLRGLGADPELGRDARVALSIVLRDRGRLDESAALSEQIGDFISAGWTYFRAARWDEVLRVADAQLAKGESSAALMLKAYVQLTAREDLAAAAAIMQQFRPEDLLQDDPARMASLLALSQRDLARTLEIVAAFPREEYAHAISPDPKRFYSGWAHRLAGRPEMATAEWRLALATVENLLRGRPNDLDLLSWKAILHAWLGEEARATETLRNQMSMSQRPDGTDALATRLSVALGLGRNEEAIQLLLTSNLDEQSVLSVHAWLRYAPEFDGLRGDPRFGKFLRDTLPRGAKPID